ncbi:hypothetical protein [Pseudoalteromonas piscicida]|uniref:Uncharacterized protein n=1 Tax=Pseudoalteromonas piscicida TaxID=43662 RepID=A0A2A5JWD2_PSEO7|nr:hypothetical protein [Pseudoalteromonas piscicida]PCK33601.1 hypothetical protein CEX98_00865 [Pseudoalteromonas piscicida]
MSIKAELGKLLFYFDRGRKTYSSYLENGSTYLYARILKENNENIVNVLSTIYCYCPEDLQEDILELTYHIDIWSSHWWALEKDLNPGPNDVFIFQNPARYPKSSEDNIVSYYRGLE